ncbi:uncharacterized protein [Rutidosis leptorrhynchoides]|uniref:uncharacterized protein n=1 Tax=Rutidosis leptorrhynchoides TaxID=125765 RepID=UPI003A98F987
MDNDLCELIKSFTFEEGEKDKWIWNLHPCEKYLTNALTKIGRIPVRVELDKRGIDLDSVRCTVCDNDLETVEHILLKCSFAKDTWNRVFRWWGIDRPLYSCLEEMFIGDIGGSKSMLWQAVEWVSGYLIWKNRNLTLFQRKKGNGPMMLNEV